MIVKIAVFINFVIFAIFATINEPFPTPFEHTSFTSSMVLQIMVNFAVFVAAFNPGHYSSFLGSTLVIFEDNIVVADRLDARPL